MRFVLCITGASGAIYGYRLLELLSSRFEIDVVISSAGAIVLKEELDKSLEDLKGEFKGVKFWDERNLTSPIASGSRLTGYSGVIVAPCSMSTLGAVANGVNSNLIHRVCEVALKERVKLVMLVREMPYSRVHIENMLKATDAGAVVVPASPGFYHRPKTLEEAVDFVVGKILDLFQIEHTLYNRWKGGGR